MNLSSGLKLFLHMPAKMSGLKGESCVASRSRASISLPWGGLGVGAFQLLVAAQVAP